KTRQTSHSDEPPAKRQRRSRSPSPYRGRSPGRGGYDRRDRDDRYDRRPGRAQLDERPVVFKIYEGKVAGIKDFGAFVQLEGVAGRVEGMYLYFLKVGSKN